MRRKFMAVDLFCGAGGLTEGLKRAGFRVIGGVEVDLLAYRTYKLNHPSVKVWNIDIRKLSGKRMMKDLKIGKEELDLLAACPPCQGFSTMRTNNGRRWNRDPRNDLIFDTLRIVRAARPKCVMLENVPGLADNQRYVKFRNALRLLGYYIEWHVLNTADYGVPQRRRRLVLLASRLGHPSFAAKAEHLRTVRQFIGSLVSPKHSRDPLHNYEVRRSEKVRDRIRGIPKNGGSRAALGQRAQLRCHKASDGFKDVYGRMAWNKPAPTITGGCINPSKGRFLHPIANRAITLREAALLQTFPKNYQFSLDKGRYPAALLIGNALPPEFIRRLARHVEKQLRSWKAASEPRG